MTRYAATMEGAQELRHLAKNLSDAVSGLEESSNKLESKIMGLGQLGDFESQIQDVVMSVTSAQSRGRDSVDSLVGKIDSLAGAVESVCTL